MKSLPTKIQHKTIETLELFMKDPFHRSLHNHALMGKYSELRSINVTGDYRIIFRELSAGLYELIEVVRVGTHSQLYK